MSEQWIHEPMTFFTDLILAGVALYCGVRISQVYWQAYHLFHFHLSWAFYLTAVAALLGGLFHGFGPEFPEIVRNLTWKTVMISTGLAATLLLLASFSLVVPHKTYLILRLISIVAIVVYVGVIWKKSDFDLVAFFFASILAFVLLMMIYVWWQTKNPGAAKVVAGLLVSLAGAVAWKSRLSVHPHFNHNDLYHVIQAIGLWLMFRGGLLLNDYPD